MEMYTDAVSKNTFVSDKAKHKRFIGLKKSTISSRETPLNVGASIVLFSVILFAYALFTVNSSTKVDTIDNQSSFFGNQKVEYPLLLNSGLVVVQEAELRIVFWFEKGKPQKDFKKDLPQEGWVWQESSFSNPISTGYSLAGFTTINQESEKRIFSWYHKLLEDVNNAGGILYLDERVQEGIDIAHYAMKQNITPRQFSLSESTISVTGWQESHLPRVVAGNDSVNIQMISQGYGQGKTALAIPVLLEEF